MVRFLQLMIFLLFCFPFLLDFAVLQAEPYNNDLARANPDVDFDNLMIGNTYNINALDTESDSLSEVPLDTISDSCICDWGISHELAGAFNPIDSCETELAIFTKGSGQITVDVDCGEEGAEIFVQDFTSRGVVIHDLSISGSGCALIQ